MDYKKLELYTSTTLDYFFYENKLIDISETQLAVFQKKTEFIHVKGIVYQRLTPIYFLWLREQARTIWRMFKQSKISAQDKDEVVEKFSVINKFALETFTEQELSIDAKEINKFSPESYNQSKDPTLSPWRTFALTNSAKERNVEVIKGKVEELKTYKVYNFGSYAKNGIEEIISVSV